MSEPALVLAGLVRRFRQGETTLEVLRGVDLTVAPGEAVALIGPSGSGKSTLLHIAGLLERPDEGAVRIAGEAAEHMGDAARTGLRRRSMGFVYQFHHLLPEFSALENAMMPQLIAGRPPQKARDRARALLDAVGLAARLEHRPARLSGGEQQRVAIARALANQPKLLLADEPTGNLDEQTAEEVFAILAALAREARLGMLVATHNLALARRMDRAVRLHEGRIQDV